MATWFGQSRAGGSPGSSGRVGGSPDLFILLLFINSQPVTHTKTVTPYQNYFNRIRYNVVVLYIICL